MTRKGYLRIILIGMVSLGGLAATGNKLLAKESTPDPRPNILLIVADDLGYGDLGCYGGDVRTTDT